MVNVQHTCEPSGGSIILPILSVPSISPINFKNLPPMKKIRYKKKSYNSSWNRSLDARRQKKFFSLIGIPEKQLPLISTQFGLYRVFTICRSRKEKKH